MRKLSNNKEWKKAVDNLHALADETIEVRSVELTRESTQNGYAYEVRVTTAKRNFYLPGKVPEKPIETLEERLNRFIYDGIIDHQRRWQEKMRAEEIVRDTIERFRGAKI